MFIVPTLWWTLCESSPGSFDECRAVPIGCRLSDKVNRLGLWVCLSAAIIYTHYYPQSLFIRKTLLCNERLSSRMYLYAMQWLKIIITSEMSDWDISTQCPFHLHFALSCSWLLFVKLCSQLWYDYDTNPIQDTTSTACVSVPCQRLFTKVLM